MATETDYAWAAGIIDGEGSLAMTRARPGINRRKTMSFQIRISVRMTHELTIRRLHDIFGGTFKPARSRNADRHRHCFEWYVGDLATVEVLRKAAPYMTTKRAHAELILEYREKCANRQAHGRGVECDEQLVALRQSYFERLQALNRRGAVAAHFPQTWKLFGEGRAV